MGENTISAAIVEGAAANGCLRSFARSRRSLFLGLAGLFSFSCRALATPPPDTALTYQQWFEGLEQPGEHRLPCCAIADCHFATARVTPAGYEVAIENSWVPVPEDRILQRISNPTGRAVVCYRHILDIENNAHPDVIRIFCFVRPPDV